MHEYDLKHKKVSVVVCTYNGEKYLGELLDSILRQTYPIYEILIKDDGSVDQTVSIARQYAVQYTNIRVEINKENLGFTNNFLTGFFMASGEFIAYCDQDDIWHPEKIEKLLFAMGEGNLAFSNSAVCDSEGNYLYPLIKKRLPVTEIISILDLTVWGHQILFRKQILYGNDITTLAQFIWLDSLLPILSFQGRDDNVVYLDDMLVNWRRHEGASSYNGKQNKYSFKGRGSLGLFFAVISWFDAPKKAQVRKYFSLLGSIHPMSKDTRKVVNLMSDCHLGGVVRSGIICLKTAKVAYSSGLTMKECIRLVIKPFITIRDQSKGISDIK